MILISHFDLSTAIRLLRIIAFLLPIIGPALYIAATNFHQEMIPTTMANVFAAQRENFPAIVEALFMRVLYHQ